MGGDGSRGRRLAWFVVLWAGGVLTVTAVAYALRAVMSAL
jgi:hypothetical protein